MEYELMDLYDSNMVKTGEVVKRSKGCKVDVPEFRFINVCVIFVENSNGDFLIQKVASSNTCACCGGHVKSGSDSYETIITEFKEEHGIDISGYDIKLFGRYKYDRCFFDVYYLKFDFDLDTFKYLEEEVDYCLWRSVEQIIKMIDNGIFRKSNIKPFYDICIKKYKDRISNNLLIINDNKDRCIIKVSDEDLNKVNDLLLTDDLDMLVQCSNEMDDIINGIIINIENELKDLFEESLVNSDITFRRSTLDKLISISNSIAHEEDNKNHFLGFIKSIYNNINGDEL